MSAKVKLPEGMQEAIGDAIGPFLYLPYGVARIAGEFVAPDDLARELNISPRTLHRWHTLRMGPPRVSIGRTILYRRTAIRTWLESREDGQRRKARK
jgi:predicted DNA-binding transcriptional regulator AlpA